MKFGKNEQNNMFNALIIILSFSILVFSILTITYYAILSYN